MQRYLDFSAPFDFDPNQTVCTVCILDQSGTMEKEDYPPNRLQAAIKAVEVMVREKVKSRPHDKMGVVGFSSTGSQLIESDDATISQWAGLIRGVGISLLISNQSAVSISQKVLSNIPNRFIAQCSGFPDLQTLGSSIGLDASAKRYLSTNLRPGLLLGSLSQGNWRHPFLFTTPLMDFPCHKIDESANQEIESLPVVPASEFENWEPEWARQEVISTEETKVVTSTQTSDTLTLPNYGLSRDERRLLDAVINDPCQPVSFFPKKLQMSTKTLIKLRKSLIAKNMVETQQIQSSGRGRPSTVLSPTQNALEMLGIK